MTIEAMTLHQWLSPAFPVGAYSYSQGLETAVAEGQVTDAASARDWIAMVLEQGAGQSDAILLSAAWQAAPDALAALTELARALCPSLERLTETDRMGAAFARAIRALYGHDLPDMPYPLAFGRAARLQDLPLDLTLTLFLQSVVANLASAAVRLIPLGQTDGQRILRDLSTRIAPLAEAAAPGDTDRIGTSALLADLASMRHETLPTRLFQS
ncbi:urease accessory protein UreF [Pseudooceanicola sp. C21-150M6]|uniref:urease accessory protein UreF n=1 Tax=Pseudooceanicola sp. C21-150M6 TaxID=3434355 RepID=UPI003D7F1C37